MKYTAKFVKLLSIFILFQFSLISVADDQTIEPYDWHHTGVYFVTKDLKSAFLWNPWDA